MSLVLHTDIKLHAVINFISITCNHPLMCIIKPKVGAIHYVRYIIHKLSKVNCFIIYSKLHKQYGILKICQYLSTIKLFELTIPQHSFVLFTILQSLLLKLHEYPCMNIKETEMRLEKHKQFRPLVSYHENRIIGNCYS